MNEIIPRLYVGSIKDGVERMFDPKFRVFGIAEELTAEYYSNISNTLEPVATYNLSDAGMKPNDMRIFVTAVNDIINLYHSTTAKILVHCISGVNRSPAVIIAVLMFLHPSLSLKDCYKMVKDKRKVINPCNRQLTLATVSNGFILDIKNDLGSLTQINFTESEKTVNRCYQTVLHRSADPDGLDHYAELIKLGHLDEVKLIALLNKSAEAIKNN